MSTNQPATPATPPPPNKDRVTPPILTRATILGVVGLLAALGIDLNVSEAQAGALSDLSIVLLPLLGTLAGTVWGALQARQKVTPLGAGDRPRDLDGGVLVRGDGQPLVSERRSRDELAEQLEEQPRPRPRVDRRGIDRDPGGL
jgi:hypothetical protein